MFGFGSTMLCTRSSTQKIVKKRAPSTRRRSTLFRIENSRSRSFGLCLHTLSFVVLTFLQRAKLWYVFFDYKKNFFCTGRKLDFLQGYALGKCSPKKKLFRSYIEMETNLREFDRCRTLYEKFLVGFDTNSLVWCEFARLESQLGEIDRARAILELGVQQEDLDIPEVGL